MMKDKRYAIKPIDLEWHQLELRYASLRIHTESAIRQFMMSIHAHGLLTPIIVVPSGEAQCPWIVIDGYLRIAALKALHHDVILATPWDLPICEALLTVYQQDTSRPWDTLEEAQLIQTLLTLHTCSKTEIAKYLGKSKTWVTHRLQLIQELPDFVHAAIQQGILSTWTASRILVPFARANTEHSQRFIRYLSINPHSSRDIQAYYLQYLQANRRIRQQMIENPCLFFNAYAFKKKDNSSLALLAPESIWENSIAQIMTSLKGLESILPTVFYSYQDRAEQEVLSALLITLSQKVQALQEILRSHIHAQPTHETNRTAPPSGRKKHS